MLAYIIVLVLIGAACGQPVTARQAAPERVISALGKGKACIE
jgi:hypothetical protein